MIYIVMLRTVILWLFAYISGNGIVTTYKKCDTEDDREVRKVLHASSICIKLEVGVDCTVSCKTSDSSMNFICQKKLSELSSSNNTLLEEWRIPETPEKCKNVAIETCSCTSNNCNNILSWD